MMSVVLAAVVSCGDGGGEAEGSGAGEEAIRDVTVEEADAMLGSGEGLVVLDIRTADEYDEGHIPGARNIDFRGEEFRDEVAALDREGKYLVHCAGGGRSGSSLAVFQELGFGEVYHLADGMNGWEAEGKTIEK